MGGGRWQALCTSHQHDSPSSLVFACHLLCFMLRLLKMFVFFPGEDLFQVIRGKKVAIRADVLQSFSTQPMLVRVNENWHQRTHDGQKEISTSEKMDSSASLIMPGSIQVLNSGSLSYQSLHGNNRNMILPPCNALPWFSGDKSASNMWPNWLLRFSRSAACGARLLPGCNCYADGHFACRPRPLKRIEIVAHFTPRLFLWSGPEKKCAWVDSAAMTRSPSPLWNDAIFYMRE